MSARNLRIASYLALPFISLLAVVAYRAALEGPSTRPRPKVILYANAADAQWQEIIKGAKAAAVRNGVELVVQSSRSAISLAQGDRSNLHSRREIAGIITAPAADGGLGLGERFAESAPLVTIGDDLVPDKRLYHIGPGNYATGRIAARLVSESLPEGGAVLVLAPRTGAGLERLQGIEQTIDLINKNAELQGIPTKFTLECEVVLREDYQAADAALDRVLAHTRADVIVDFVGVYRGSQAEGIRRNANGRHPRWITVDQSDAALAGVEAGAVDAVLATDSQQLGYQAVSALALSFRDGPLGMPARGKGLIHVFPRVIRQGDVDSFRAEPLAALASPVI